MPRMFVMIGLLFALSTSGFAATHAAAQEATPTAGEDHLFADTMGLPELAINATADALEGIPAETAAGRYVVTLKAEADVEFGAGVEFLMLPQDIRFDDFMTLVSEAESVEAPPEWYYQTYLPGGAAADAGFSSQVIIDLRPGSYVVWSGDPTAPQTPVELTVTGEAATPTTAEEPAASATVTMFEYGFTLDGQLVPGPQVLKVANVGAQPHFTILLGPTGPVTKEQVGTLLDAEMAGTPTADAAAAAGVSNPDEWPFAGYAGTLSMGGAEWIPVDLEPGTYVLVCFVPDIQSGMPHAYLGMYDVVTVGDEGTPTS